jgi:tetratricopeptide (TPR) repeat protein/predicted aspartyl protease
MHPLTTYRAAIALALLLACNAALATQPDKCQLTRLIELPLSIEGLRSTIPAKINGHDATFTLDSGAFWSTLTLAAAKQFGLSVDYSRVGNLKLTGVGGTVSPGVTSIKDLTIFNLPLHKIDFLVVGTDIGNGTAGLIGQNLLRVADLEYDLGHGTLRFFRPKDCGNHNLAYWRKAGEDYSVLDMESTDVAQPHTIVTVLLNGQKIRAMLDTGAATSMITLRAAKRAGVTPDSEGVTPAGASFGIGHRRIENWIGRFESFEIGGEKIRNARLRISDMELREDMLLGADFFLSHHIMVANSQHRLYLTYNGGPVFDLRLRPAKAEAEANAAPVPPAAEPAAAAAAAAAPTSAPVPGAPPESTPAAAASAATAAPAPTAPADTPTDAAGFARRGAVFLARNDPAHAFADYTRAVELAPDDNGYRVERARLLLRRGDRGAALDELNHVLSRDPQSIDALFTRAGVQLSERKPEATVADLATLDAALPKESVQRQELARMYEAADRPDAAIAQWNGWIELHQDDARLPMAQNSRCFDRALLGTELKEALKDCNAALRRTPKSPLFLDSRGLVYLRSGEWNKAIADYDAVLAQSPRVAWSMYGRGIARLRIGKTAEGEADLKAAATVAPRLIERARHFGIVP